MCRFDQGFILCTCAPPGQKPVVHNKKSRRHKKNGTPAEEPTEYLWSLHRYIGPSEDYMLGLYRFPSADIGEGLTAEWVLMNLNLRNCFDFEYTPAEKDCLRMRSEKFGQYLAFLYEGGEWKEGVHDPFLVDEHLLFHGDVKQNRE